MQLPETTVYSCDICESKRGAKPYDITTDGETRRVILCKDHSQVLGEALQHAVPVAPAPKVRAATPTGLSEASLLALHQPRPPGL